MEPKLRVGIHFDLDRRTARLEVRGMVTEQNCRVLYVLVRRANSALPGLTVLLDLRRAAVTKGAMAGLVRSSETGFLPVPVVQVKGGTLAPRQLSILAPA
ncbi:MULTISPECIES: hypothetical protein [unclassified Arthrobacter]|uniref:hypothetical protein n=1 Tax=unclassified Arthrobacter TaxID=235627 RepID=UPI001E5F3059|nr:MULTISPECIES: hypothetical protein [unclassified Arthrobacter]MCC9144943.1 hypothetical protein [Arthrobacter sp. zg-Y919]MDK1276171.1 hypothetical protein [Arthrobacter sp. zg.Y919]WIB02489.1 hypothetical protein QNO10_11045 [Arthrobacter sp. zg-Y919]